MTDAAPAEETPESMTIVAWSGDLDKIWPTLILGSTGAAYGMQTTIFFTFWGLFPLVRDDVRITGTNAMTKGLAAMNPPGVSNMKLSKLNMGGAGAWMMKRLARNNKVASPNALVGRELLATAATPGYRTRRAVRQARTGIRVHPR